MSDLLPILRSQAPQMNLCASCPVPGHCCTGFILSDNRVPFTAWESSWREDALAYIERRGLDFVPSQLTDIIVDAASEKPYGLVRFTCKHLNESGRCGIYETRPRVCRTYLPGLGGLCVFNLHPGVNEI